MTQNLHITTEALKAAPPFVVSSLYVGGLSLSDWVATLTIIYIVLQIGLLLPRYFGSIRNWWGRR